MCLLPEFREAWIPSHIWVIETAYSSLFSRAALGQDSITGCIAGYLISYQVCKEVWLLEDRWEGTCLVTARVLGWAA